MPTRAMNPYLNFPSGTGREALVFYQSVLGGTVEAMGFADIGMEGPADALMHGTLETSDGFVLMGSDAQDDAPTTSGNVTLILGGDDDATLRGWFDRLAEGGEVLMKLEPQPWGDVYGMCRDRFGIAWAVNISQSQS